MSVGSNMGIAVYPPNVVISHHAPPPIFVLLEPLVRCRAGGRSKSRGGGINVGREPEGRGGGVRASAKVMCIKQVQERLSFAKDYHTHKYVHDPTDAVHDLTKLVFIWPAKTCSECLPRHEYLSMPYTDRSSKSTSFKQCLCFSKTLSASAQRRLHRRRDRMVVASHHPH